ncbi:hypothetical protein PHISP_05347 [Aspergillus sp. HF37]|nr:hypothetical protein PHISP_05347 [Aspergillus sp. HF37]
MDTSTENASAQPDEYSRSGKSRFRFKVSKPSQGSSRGSSGTHRDRPHNHDGHHRRHRHRHRRHHSPKPSSHRNDHHNHHEPNSHDPRLSAEAAFRESLFDALGDDEGAEYWESIYGQPIHTYSVPNVPTGPEGELEQMSEEEYAAYVRARMWERTREGMMEEQERVRQERAQQKRREEADERSRSERVRFETAMDESLRRGRERRRMKKAWGAAWEEYRRSWEVVEQQAQVARREVDKPPKPLRNLVFWPVESGKRRDVSQAAVEEFMRHASASASAPEQGDGNAKARSDDDDDLLLATLKSERVRWHPDKIQHRYGVLGIDDAVMRSVTEVFQIVDRMWSEMREKTG